MRKPIYLDYMATTPIDESVLQKMLAYMRWEGDFGNGASTLHAYGRAAEQAIAASRKNIADVIHGEVEGIVFTSGATESINLALKGAANFYQRQGRHIITTQIEHKSVLDTCRYLARQGFSVTYLPVKKNGLLDIHCLKEAIRKDTILVSIGHVNNEVGVIQDIPSIGDYLRSKGILFHVDAAQSIGKVNVHVKEMKVDLLSLSAHKAYGPKGIGVLYVRQHPRLHLEPLIHGGGQENNLRSGTLATHQIVGMAEAFRIAELERVAESQRLLILRDYLWRSIHTIPGIRVNGDLSARVANNLHVNFYSVPGNKGVRLRSFFSEAVFEHFAISRGSACLIASHEPSYVLKALGLSNEEILHSFRISLGKFTVLEDINELTEYILDC